MRRSCSNRVPLDVLVQLRGLAVSPRVSVAEGLRTPQQAMPVSDPLRMGVVYRG